MAESKRFRSSSVPSKNRHLKSRSIQKTTCHSVLPPFVSSLHHCCQCVTSTLPCYHVAERVHFLGNMTSKAITSFTQRKENEAPIMILEHELADFFCYDHNSLRIFLIEGLFLGPQRVSCTYTVFRANQSASFSHSGRRSCRPTKVLAEAQVCAFTALHVQCSLVQSYTCATTNQIVGVEVLHVTYPDGDLKNHEVSGTMIS